MSLNSQFTVALNGIICFSARFCNDALLVLKMIFQVFYFASKNVQGFSKERKMLMFHCSFIYKTMSQFFEILNFSQVFVWGSVIMSMKSTSFPKELWWMPFISWIKQIKRNLIHRFVDERQLKTITSK